MYLFILLLKPCHIICRIVNFFAHTTYTLFVLFKYSVFLVHLYLRVCVRSLETDEFWVYDLLSFLASSIHWVACVPEVVKL
jgi:hypothetical protein